MKFKFTSFILRILGLRSCINSIFNKLLKQDAKLKELKVSRYLPVLGFILELIVEIGGIFTVYLVIEQLAPIFVGKSFNNNFLYSMVFLPTVTSLKKLPETTKSLFVRVAISDEYIICKRGYFRKFIDKLYIKHIDNIEVRTTLWGEWFNYGTITLYSFGGSITLPFLKNPHKVYIKIKRLMKERNGF